MTRRWRVLLAMAVPLLLIAAGACGYRLVEGWSAFDSLYMSVITLTTVGFGEVHPLSHAGRVFTMALILGGVFTMFYAATSLIGAAVSGQLRTLFGRNRMQERLAKLHDHVIVCGYGRMGRQVCQELSALAVPFVAIDKSPALLEGFALAHGVPLAGDASLDEVLNQAGIARARALVTVVSSDADNLFITMSARLLSDALIIVARAEDERGEPKLMRAGATRVVSPYVIGGYRVAHAVIRPTVVDFIELTTRSAHLGLQIEETMLLGDSPLAEHPLAEAGGAQDGDLIVVAIKRAAGAMLFNPAPATILSAGDTLITIGGREQTERLAHKARAR